MHGLIGSPFHFRQLMLRLHNIGLPLHAPKLDYLAGDMTELVNQVGRGDVEVGNSIGCDVALQCSAC